MAIRIEESPLRGMTPDLDQGKDHKHRKIWQRLQRLFDNDKSDRSRSPKSPTSPRNDLQQPEMSPGPRRDFGRSVGVGLPRPLTFTRQNSEKRERLEAVKPCHSERRAVSAQRQKRATSAARPRSTSSPSTKIPSQVSAPSLPLVNGTDHDLRGRNGFSTGRSAEDLADASNQNNPSHVPDRSPSQTSSERLDAAARDEKYQIDLELDVRWILNLSMYFRDNSDREKFFVTFAEKPNLWRRVTISCDYRNAESDSLEMDLKDLRYQRDKNSQIYESLRDSLPTIKFYNTVTNLKLQTEQGRLHVHVTEDVNEIIPYPPLLSVQHILADRQFPVKVACESEIAFLAHLSGFVYKVCFQDREYIKKEIPGPDTVDEFLYEVNALHALSDSTCVIKLEAIVVDDSRLTVKGLLISYAQRGALVDLLYDHKGKIPWSDRLRWAQQAVKGLSEIHEEGYVQGDFTLSNIVVDGDNNAKIIDINRRGCPIGWEPPEIADKIMTHQRISMYIGQKSDLFQLGMTLWALAMDEDEPERHDPPLILTRPDIPEWFKNITSICLSQKPRDRLSAKELLTLFQISEEHTPPSSVFLTNGVCGNGTRTPKKYIEPEAAVERADLEKEDRRPRGSRSPNSSTDDGSIVNASSSDYHCDSGSSYVQIQSTRSPGSSSEDQVYSRIVAENRPQRNGAPEYNNEEPFVISRTPYPEDSHLTQIDLEAPFSQPTVSADAQSRQSAVSLVDVCFSPHGGNQFPTGGLAPANPDEQALTTSAPSLTSESTPRIQNSTVASTSSILTPQIIDQTHVELTGLGSNPALDQYSDHEPSQMTELQNSQYYDTQTQPESLPDLSHSVSSPNDDQVSDQEQPNLEAVSEVVNGTDISDAPDLGAEDLRVDAGSDLDTEIIARSSFDEATKSAPPEAEESSQNLHLGSLPVQTEQPRVENTSESTDTHSTVEKLPESKPADPAQTQAPVISPSTDTPTPALPQTDTFASPHANMSV